MKVARGSGCTRRGSWVATASVSATVSAASDSTFHPNQSSTDATNPANGPKASSM